jgi:hypothetical protein
MKRIYKVLPEKFKRLYFYRFLFMQIWYAFSFTAIILSAYFPPADYIKSPVIRYALYILIGISTVLWFLSFGYFGKKDSSKNTFILIRDGSLMYKTIRAASNSTRFHPRSHVYIYRVNHMSRLSVDKRHMMLYGDVKMEKRDGFYIDEILAVNRYSRIKIPNIFEEACIDDLKVFITRTPEYESSVDSFVSF